MTPAALLLALARSGLSQAGLADAIGVNVVTVNRWIRGARTILPAAIEYLDSLVAKQDAAVKEAVHLWRDKQAERVRIVIYRDDTHDSRWTGFPTASTHLAVVRRLAESNMPVEPILFDATEYRRWNRGHPDNKARRALWAASVSLGLSA